MTELFSAGQTHYHAVEFGGHNEVWTSKQIGIGRAAVRFQSTGNTRYAAAWAKMKKGILTPLSSKVIETCLAQNEAVSKHPQAPSSAGKETVEMCAMVPPPRPDEIRSYEIVLSECIREFSAKSITIAAAININSTAPSLPSASSSSTSSFSTTSSVAPGASPTSTEKKKCPFKGYAMKASHTAIALPGWTRDELDSMVRCCWSCNEQKATDAVDGGSSPKARGAARK